MGSLPLPPPGNVGLWSSYNFQSCTVSYIITGSSPRSTFKGQAAFLSPHNERAYFPPYAGNEGLYTHWLRMATFTICSGPRSTVVLFSCMLNQSCPTLCNLSVDSQASCPWDSPGKNTGVGISSSRGSSQSKDPNPCLLHAGMQTQLQKPITVLSQ